MEGGRHIFGDRRCLGNLVHHRPGSGLLYFWKEPRGARQASAIHDIEIVFLILLLFAVAFGALARRLAIPYPIVLVIGGLLLGSVPGIPKITLNPELVFFAILPPLFYSAAWLTSWRESSYNLVSIFLLAFGLVIFTVVGVTEVGQWLLPGFDWRVGLVLGAVVAPTDAIAATSIAKRLGLPRRMVDILEGNSSRERHRENTSPAWGIPEAESVSAAYRSIRLEVRSG